MAVESYGRTDDGIAWEVRHRLWSGPWWWVLTMPDGQVRQSPDMYETERQARDAVEDARRQALAGLPPVETMSSLRARAEAAEARVAEAEADARLMLHVLVALDESEGTNVVNYWQELGLSDGECAALRRRFDTPAPGVQELELAAVRRILAAAGST